MQAEGNGGCGKQHRRGQEPAGNAQAISGQEAQETGLFGVQRGGGHEGISQQEHLRQGKEDQHEGDAGAGTHIVTHAGDDALGHLEADQKACADHHEARGDDGGEGQIQCLDNGVPLVHRLPEFPVAGRDHDGIVDIRAHLDGADDQIAEEEYIIALQSGDGKVHPDAALDHQDQQQGHAEGLEGEEQDQHHQHQAHEAHHCVIRGEGIPEAQGAHRIAGEDNAAVIILGGDMVDLVQEAEGLLRLDRQIQVQHQAAVIVAHQLTADHAELVKELLDERHLVLFQLHIPGLYPLMQEEEQIQKRGLVAGQILTDSPMVPLFGGIIGIHRLGADLIDPGDALKFGVIHLIGDGVALDGLNIGQAHGGLDLRAELQLLQQLPLGGVVPGGDHHGHHIAVAKDFPDLLLGALILGLAEGGDHVHAVGIVHPAEGQIGAHHQQYQQDGHHEAGLVGKFADRRDLGDKAAVFGLVHGLAEGHQQRRHEEEHREQAAEDGLDQGHAHIHAQAELHEGHGREPGDGGQAAGKDLRNGGGQGLHHGVMDVQALVLFLVAVAEDDGIVHRQGQLQHNGHGVGYEGDGPHQKVGADVDDGRHHKGQDHHRDLGIGAGGKDQHGQDHDDHEDQHGQHLLRHQIGEAEAYLRVDGDVPVSQQRLHLLQSLLAAFRGCHIRKGQVEERGIVLIVGSALVKLDQDHILYLGKLPGQGFGILEADVLHHDLGGAVGDELLLHDGQALLGFGVLRQIGGDILFHLDPSQGEHREHEHRREKQQDPSPSVHHEARKPCHKALVFLVHGKVSPFRKRITGCAGSAPPGSAPARPRPAPGNEA